MQKTNKDKIKNTLKIISLIFFLSIFIVGLVNTGEFLYKLFRPNNNQVVVSKGQLQEVKPIKINDSLTILKQLLLISETKKQMLTNTDSVIQEAIRKAKISPEQSAGWTSVIGGNQRIIQLNDSLTLAFEKLEQTQQALSLTDKDKAALKASYEADKKKLLATRIAFREETEYRKLAGSFGFDGKLQIDEDTVISKPFIVFGEKNRFFKRPEYSAIVGDKNPFVKQKDVYSATYKPKPKLQISLGTIGMANQKSLSTGAGVTFKKGIWSATFGYQFFNVNYK